MEIDQCGSHKMCKQECDINLCPLYYSMPATVEVLRLRCHSQAFYIPHVTAIHTVQGKVFILMQTIYNSLSIGC